MTSPFIQQDKLCEWSFIPTKGFSYEFVFRRLVFCGFACETGDALQAVASDKALTCSQTGIWLVDLHSVNSLFVTLHFHTLQGVSLNEVTYHMIQSKVFQLML